MLQMQNKNLKCCVYNIESSHRKQNPYFVHRSKWGSSSSSSSSSRRCDRRRCRSGLCLRYCYCYCSRPCCCR